MTLDLQPIKDSLGHQLMGIGAYENTKALIAEVEKLREAMRLAIDGIENCGCCCDRRLPEIKEVLK